MSQVAGGAFDREQLILEHLKQVRIIAQSFRRRCPPEVLLEDLVSVGTVGLLEAVRRHDSRHGLKLKTLAEHRIRGAMLDYLRSLDPLPRSIRRFQHRRDAVRGVGSALHQTGDEGIAIALGMPVSKYRQLDLAVQAARPLNLEAVVAESGDRIVASQTTETAILIADQRQVLGREIEVLHGDERLVIQALRDGSSLRQIAHELGLSVSAVLQLKRGAIHRLRTRLNLAIPRRYSNS